MSFAALSGEDIGEVDVPMVVTLIHEAGNPYLDWFFGDSERARLTLERWVRRSSSEYALGRVRTVFAGDDLAGIYVGLGGAELAACRKADAVTVFKEAGAEGRSALRDRLAQRRGLFPEVTDDEFYLSNIGVAASQRGKGLCRQLLDMYLAEGRAAGYSRFRLDVSSANVPAQRLYETFGFRTFHDYSTPDGQLSYRSLILDAARV